MSKGNLLDDDPFDLDIFGENFFDLDNEDELVCECGSEKVFGEDTNVHSSWCPKNEKEE